MKRGSVSLKVRGYRHTVSTLIAYPILLLLLSFTIVSPASPLSAPQLTYNISNNNLTISWTAVSGATGYKANVGYQSGVYTVKDLDLGNITSIGPFDLNALPAGTYYIAVSAYNATSSSPLSNEIAITVLNLSAPNNLRYTLNGNTLTIQWDVSSGATGYKIGLGIQSGIYSGPYDVGNILQIGPVDISGISPGTYYLSVKSYNQSGESGYSNEIAITWSVVPPTYTLSSDQKALIASNGNPQYFTIVFNPDPQRREETWVYIQLKKMYLFWDGALVDLRDVTIDPNAYSNPPSLDPSLFTKDTQIQHVVQLFGSNYTTAGESDISSLLGPSDYKTIYYSDKGLFITFSGNDLTVVLTMDMPNK